MNERRVRLRIHGRVQGVFFRETTRQRAERLGVRGWVKNLPDGTVEALAEGPADAVAELVAFCRQGPPAARVDRVDETEEAPAAGFERFERFTVERG